MNSSVPLNGSLALNECSGLNIANDQSVNFLAMREDGTCTISYKDMITFVESLQYKITYVKE